MRFVIEKIGKRVGVGVALFALLIGLLACGRKEEGTKVIFTTGPGKDEVYRIGDEVCNIPEMMIYLTTTQNQYESVYGDEIWNTSWNGVTLEQNVKETVLEKNAQIKTMYLLAKNKNIVLAEEEQKKVAQAAEEYINGLNPIEKELLDVSGSLVEKLYTEYALADKVYQSIVQEINPEISDDEARIITVQHIFFRTYGKDEKEQRVEYDANRKQEILEKANMVRDLAVSGEEDFLELAAHYSDDSTVVYSFGKGEMDPAIEEAAFLLETDEVSQVITSENGYHIMKCINTLNREETDANKHGIVEARRNEAFGTEYNGFVEGLAKRLNSTVWNQISFLKDERVTTQNFFEVYDKYFGGKE